MAILRQFIVHTNISKGWINDFFTHLLHSVRKRLCWVHACGTQRNISNCVPKYDVWEGKQTCIGIWELIHSYIGMQGRGNPNPLSLQLIHLCADEREEGHALRPKPKKLFLTVASLIPFQFHNHEGFCNFSVYNISLFYRNSLCGRSKYLPCRGSVVSLVNWSALATVLRPSKTI